MARYSLASTLKLLPGLRLDTFTVLGDADYRRGYETPDDLAREGSDWGELRFTSPICALLGTREIYEQEVPEDRLSIKNFGIWGDKLLLADGGHKKEMTIVTRRGAGIDYAEAKGSPFIRSDIPQGHGGADVVCYQTLLR
ncbi:hypothetical protein DL768_002000 [Monosporascus sp. mg162]|nr:hypothetical protein DL768_002000 [Monosporascus sp. mg162]